MTHVIDSKQLLVQPMGNPEFPLQYPQIPPSQLVFCLPRRLFSCCLNFYPTATTCGYLVICLPTNESDGICWRLKTTTSAPNWKCQIFLYGCHEFLFHDLSSANPVDYPSRCLNFYPTVMVCGYFVFYFSM